MGVGAGFHFSAIDFFRQRALFGRGDRAAFKFSQRVELRSQVANLGPARWATALTLRVDTVEREACMAAGSDVLMGHYGLGEISELSRDFLALQAAGSV